MVRVINERDSVMTNFEVASLLMQQQRQRDEDEKALPLPGARRGESSGTTPWSSQQSAAIVGEQVMSYLEAHGCATQTQESIMEFMEEAKAFELTRMETLACINTPPASVVEVYLLVEECEERLDEQKVRDFLLLCQRTLGAPSAGQMSGVSDSEQHASGDGDGDGAGAAEGE